MSDKTKIQRCDSSANSTFVKVLHGANAAFFDVAAESIASVRVSLTDAFNIPIEAVSFVNGKSVQLEFQLRSRDILEFILPWGRKGTTDERNEYFVRSSDPQLKLNEIIFRLGRLEDLLKNVVNEQAPAKEFYSVEEFAKLVDLAPYTVREHCRLERLRAEKTECGRGNIPEWRIPHLELVRYRNYGLLPRRKDGG